MNKLTSHKRWLAIITATLSIVIGLIYLILITILDSRGPMMPPPPEAMASVEVVSFDFVELDQSHS